MAATDLEFTFGVLGMLTKGIHVDSPCFFSLIPKCLDVRKREFKNVTAGRSTEKKKFIWKMWYNVFNHKYYSES